MRKKKFGISTQHYSFVVKSFVELVKQFNTAEYEFVIRETKTREVVEDVRSSRSEIGIIYLSDFNSKIILNLLKSNDLEFHKLIECDAYVYLWKGHPLLRFRTGDIGWIDKTPCSCGRTHGRIHINGRKDDMFIVSAVNVFPSDIEAVIRDLSGITGEYLIRVFEKDFTCKYSVEIEKSADNEKSDDEVAKIVSDALKSSISYCSSADNRNRKKSPRFSYGRCCCSLAGGCDYRFEIRR